MDNLNDWVRRRNLALAILALIGFVLCVGFWNTVYGLSCALREVQDLCLCHVAKKPV